MRRLRFPFLGLVLLTACGDGTGDPDAAASMDGAPLADAGGLDGAVGADGGPGCPGLTVPCGAECVIPSVDPDHCGACGVICAATEACVSGGCVGSCPDGLSMCDRACVDTDTDNAHCGTCGTACDVGEGCMGGACVPSVPLGPGPEGCVGGGPPIVIRDAPAAEGVCADRTAAITFTWGLCSCDDVGLPELSSETRIDAFDSTVGPYEPGGAGGGMAANGRIRTSELDVSGDVRVAGEEGLRTARSDIGQEVRSGGDLRTGETMRIGEDAFVAGAMEGRIEIAGALHTPDCGGVPGDVSHASCVDGAVTVPPPCACAPSELVPIAAIVAHYAMPANNDNAIVMLEPDVFTTSGGPRRLDLPCGYYYLDAIEGAVTIAAHGRTALFIGGDVDAGSAMAFVVDPAPRSTCSSGGRCAPPPRSASARPPTPATFVSTSEASTRRSIRRARST